PLTAEDRVLTAEPTPLTAEDRVLTAEPAHPTAEERVLTAGKHIRKLKVVQTSINPTTNRI
ncbi:hypothetical protein, partial [Allobacillus salarius]|uniref:hypothetical protein n=2 Tax=Allobacillus TaxID=1400133 RepID=UPI00164243B6